MVPSEPYAGMQDMQAELPTEPVHQRKRAPLPGLLPLWHREGPGFQGGCLAVLLRRDSECQAFPLHEEAPPVGNSPDRVDSLPIHGDRDRALVRLVLRRPGHFYPGCPGTPFHGLDQVPSRAVKDNPVKLPREPVKYAPCLSEVRGNSGFPEKAREIG